MKELKIAIIGYGKMGKTIEQLAKDRGHTIKLKIRSTNRGEMTEEALQGCDVAIDFSRPESAFENITKCLNAGVPIISGTTGWLDKYEEVQELCKIKNGSFLYASNFSVGMNLFFKMNQWLADKMKYLETYAPSITEIHHTEKLDAPSGTAITLGNEIVERLPRLNGWVLEDNSNSEDLPIYPKRLPGVPGTHAINYDSPVDTIEIKHTAHTRDGFALGAIMASEWIQNRQGIFTMQDVLDL